MIFCRIGFRKPSFFIKIIKKKLNKSNRLINLNIKTQYKIDAIYLDLFSTGTLYIYVCNVEINKIYEKKNTEYYTKR